MGMVAATTPSGPSAAVQASAPRATQLAGVDGGGGIGGMSQSSASMHTPPV